MKNFITVLLSALLITSGCTSPAAVVAPKQAAQNATEFGPANSYEDRLSHNERTGFSYAFEYDNNNMYLYMTASDQDLISKIVLFGLTVWIDRTGGNNEVQGFRFPLNANIPVATRQAGSAASRPAISRPALFGNDLNSVLSRANEIELIGIYGSSVRKVRKRDSQIRVNSQINDSILIYQAVIPYEVLGFGFNPVIDNNPISIGFETGHFESPSAGRRPSPYGGRQSDGMGYPQGGAGQMQGQFPGRIPERDMMAQRGSAFGNLSRPTRLWLELEFL